MEQWFFRITAYADQLLDDLRLIDWPERTKTIQTNWIGRSEGSEVLFRDEDLDTDIAVFTTRPDTLFGASFFVLAPEHPLVERIDNDEVREYVSKAATRPVAERQTKEKDGVFTGHYVVNPLNDERIPVWVADYVLMDYGTGAIMAVPAHDERDLDFAQRYDLPVRPVIDEETNVLVDSGEFSGLPAEAARKQIVAWLREQGRGAPAVSYRLRDWSMSRQRYWGCPIPVVYCEEDGIVPVPEDQLPVELPEVDDFRPKGKPPLASNEEWMNVPCPRCGRPARREADTMDTFVDSSWYFLRYCDPHNDHAAWDRRIVDYWMPVDQYIGGIDHATGHLLYSRFFVKALNDFDLVGFREPFQRLFHQGWVRQGGTKMSKSKGNVTGPDQLVDLYGADAVRLYILFVGPADQDSDWTEEGVEGISRFLRRLWRIVNEVVERAPQGDPGSTDLARTAHRTIARVTDDIDRRFQFNTPIAAVMELANELGRAPEDPAARFAAETAVTLIQPYAPHIAEELWSRLGHERLWDQPWPAADAGMLERETFELVIQVNGRVRDRVEVSSDSSEEELVAQAKASPRVQAYLDGKEIRQEIVVPGKLVNLVIA
jgi:leucyl-tRNA synthetase